MNTKTIEQFDVMTLEMLASVEGGASMCDWVVGGSGVALSTLYGAAFGMAFGNVPGAIAGAAVGLGWIPVASLCP